jgi:hypothetical protein
MDPGDGASTADEAFWQITAIELLGKIPSARAARPLLKVLLTPSKKVLFGDVDLSLLKIGKPATDAALALLRGEDRELVELARKGALEAAKSDPRAADAAHLGAAAGVLAMTGRTEISGPLLDALHKTTNPVAKVLIARELPRLPRTAETVKAFWETLEELPVALPVPGAARAARDALLEVAPNFFDSSLVPRVVRAARDTKGTEAEVSFVRDTAMDAVLRLATADQVKLIDDLGTLRNGGMSLAEARRDDIGRAKALLARCAKDVVCYLGVLTEPGANTDDGRSIGVKAGVKAAYQIGILGNADTRAKLVAVLPLISNPSVEFAALAALEALSPHGGAEIVEELRKRWEQTRASKDPTRRRFSPVYQRFLMRMESRTRP